MLRVGDKFKSIITGATYVVKKIKDRMVVLERQNRKSQVATELSNLKLFYEREEKEEDTKSHPRPVNFERRKCPRFNVYWPAQFNQIGLSIRHNGRVTNLSQGGMLIQSSGQMEIGQHLRSKVSFILGSEINSIEMVAEVVRMDICSGKAWGDYQCGAKFLNISPTDKTKLNNLLMTLPQ